MSDQSRLTPWWRAVLDRHRRHIELSPGAGANAQSYSLAVIDDIEADLTRSTPQSESGRITVEVSKSSDGRVFSNVIQGGKVLAHLKAGESYTVGQDQERCSFCSEPAREDHCGNFGCPYGRETEPAVLPSAGVQSATEASIKEKVASWFAAYDDGRWDADDVIINVAHALGIKPPEILKDATVGPGGGK